MVCKNSAIKKMIKNDGNSIEMKMYQNYYFFFSVAQRGLRNYRGGIIKL
jgi:hypothetical protein